MSTYVYGIADAGHPGLPEGTVGVGNPGLPLRTVKGGGLVALVSDAPENLRPKRRDLLAHQNVLSEAGSGGTVLPMRFGSVADDDEAVSAALAERKDHYQERLAALHERVEYNVKAQHDEEAVLHTVLAENPDARALRESNRNAGGGSHQDKLRLGELVATAVQHREARDAVVVRDALEPHAEAVSAAPESTGWITNLSFLVGRSSYQPLLEAVDELRRAHPHLVLQVNGPLAPYSFVEPDAAQPAAG